MATPARVKKEIEVSPYSTSSSPWWLNPVNKLITIVSCYEKESVTQ